MTQERLKAIAERAAKATPGPYVRWKEHSEVFAGNNGGENEPGVISGSCIARCEPSDLPDFDGEMADDEDAYIIQAEHNAEFIAHARTDIPDLLAHISTLESELQQVKVERDGMREALVTIRDHERPFLGTECRAIAGAALAPAPAARTETEC